jgi:hypothetical protein
MKVLRQELQNYARACEELLSNQLQERLTEDEQELIVYYLNELFDKFGHKPLAVHQASLNGRSDSADIPKRSIERRRKMYTKQLQLEEGILHAVVTGEFELTGAQIDFLELLDAAHRRGATKVLIDGQQMTGSPADFERFLYGEFAAWATLEVMKERKTTVRFAYVIHEPLRDPHRFGENVAVNRGMDVKTFEDTNAAREWLNET